MSQRSAAIAYTRDFGLSMGAYVVSLPISLALLDRVDQPLKTVVALIPLIPAGFALVAYLRFLGRMDELGKRIQLEALGFGFGAAGMLALAYGFLENPAALLHLGVPPDDRALGHRWRDRVVPLPMKNRLRVLRAERDWSQSELADRLDVSRQTVNALENSKYDPSLPLAFRIAQLFSLRIEDVFQPE
jgi:putative transcriptional regulator